MSSNDPSLRRTTLAERSFIACGLWAAIRCRAAASDMLRLCISRAICSSSGASTTQTVSQPDARSELEQLDRFDDDDALFRPPDQQVDGVRDQRVDDRLEFLQGVRIGEGNLGHAAAVDLSLLVQDPIAEGLQHQVVAGGALGHGAMGQGIGVDAVGAKVLEHLAHDALARGDVAGQTDDVLTLPSAQGAPPSDTMAK